ncbi:hypothetical protein HYU94_01005, partial [Candidatus Daviesbacteria bacterium]|nr:hypothetical protein [Candidatus Daviesbacteria bacterium]
MVYKLLSWFVVFVLLIVLSGAVYAAPKKTFSIPPHAKKISPTLYDLGQKNINGRLAQGYAFIHLKDPSDKSAFAKGQGGRKTATSCYGFLAKDARWKVNEPYILEATNSSGLSPDYIASASAVSMLTWDNQVSFGLFGSRIDGVVDGADTTAPDGKNEIYFASISDPGTIAVTIIWGYFSGPTFARELLEYDMVFDDADFRWGDAATDPTVMDFQNIATHELGHAAGMADLYTSSCTQETMYGYATEGETSKRD